MAAELQSKGELKIFIKNSFEKDGETVEYCTGYFLCGEEGAKQSVLIVNTKQDLAPQLDEYGTINVRVGENGKLSLVSFKSGE